MDVQTEQSSPQSSPIRIYLLGPLKIEYGNEDGSSSPLPEECFQGGDTYTALVLLKVLLSQPHRKASKDWLIQQLWPKSAEHQKHRIDNSASRLRSLLRPPKSQLNLLQSTRGNRPGGNIYELAEYPHIWLDVDAFQWNVNQAVRMERFGDASLPFWDAAYKLAARGQYLPDELPNCWVLPIRSLIQGNARQCILHLAHILIEAGASQEAMLRLRTFWVVNVTDEDILRPLMELLAIHECFQEALDYYECLKNTLAQEGRHPDPRTQDMAAYVSVKPIQRERLVTSPHA